MHPDDEERRKWPVRLFFTGVTLFLAGGVLYFALGTKDPQFYWQPAKPSGELRIADPVVGTSIVLTRDRTCHLRKVALVYRGVERGMLRIDTTLLEMDPDYAYVHHYPPTEAEAIGMRMGGYGFRVVRWSRWRIRLERIR